MATDTRTNDMDKIIQVHKILRTMYEAPTKGNKGTVPRLLYSSSAKELADALGVTAATFYRFIQKPQLQYILELYGIESYKEPALRETRYVYNPEISSVTGEANVDTLAYEATMNSVMGKAITKPATKSSEPTRPENKALSLLYAEMDKFYAKYIEYMQGEDDTGKQLIDALTNGVGKIEIKLVPIKKEDSK